MRVLVTGAAGFVGSTLADALLDAGQEVVGLDNFSTGQVRHLERARENSRYSLVEGDLLDGISAARALAGCEMVYHLAAHADVRSGTAHPRRDLEQNTVATAMLLEAMKDAGVSRLFFASSGAVYGNAAMVPTPEEAPFPEQTSFYGASKLACEGLIAAYVHGFGFSATALRFVSLLGPRYGHGHVLDFSRQLFLDPTRLRVLGDGQQRKSYLHVDDCVAAIRLLTDLQIDGRYRVFNVGHDETCIVDQSIDWIAGELGLHPVLSYSGGKSGWVGDSPLIQLDCSRLRSLGWAPTRSIEESVRQTVRWIRDNGWIMDR